MLEAVKDAHQYSSFNDFFTRELAPDARDVDFSKEVLISPADGKVLVYENINSTLEINVKNTNFNIGNLLQNSTLAKKFENCSIAIIRLAPTDYHRFHFPTDGLVSQTRLVKGLYYSVSPIALEIKPSIFWENKRTICEIENDTFGSYVYMEVGATMVGSIKQTYQSGTHIKKGDEKGYFEFGGSTVILIFQKDKVFFDKELIMNTQKGHETKIKMGERIGALCS